MFIKSKKFIPYNGDLKENVRQLRQNATKAEKKLWYEYLRGHEYRFVRQKIIGNYIIDFYCQKLKLAIEIDGESHLGDRNEEYDKTRTAELDRFGIKVLRFWNNEVVDGLSGVESCIEEEVVNRVALLRKEG